MRFGVLGSVEVWSADGTVVPVGGPRVRTLLAMLALNAGRVVGPDRLLDGLYGEDQPAGAANALQSQVSRLRRGLGDAGGLVEFHPAGYRLAADPDDVDAHRFGRWADAGRHALTSGDPAEAVRLLDAALGCWRGPMLADVADAPFAAAEIVRWRERQLAATEDRTEARLILGRYDGLVADLRGAVAAHPLRERLWGQLMRALHGEGRSAEALAVFDQARRLLADELGTDPSAELAAIQLSVLRAEPMPAPTATPPTVRAEPVTPTRAEAPVDAGDPGRTRTLTPLPAQLTSFVGRDDELARIGKLLDAGRLVTVTGPGGAGKTRIAVESGERAAGRVCFVDLAPLGSGTELPQALLSALGLREASLLQPGSGRPDFEGRLVAALSLEDTLLILDNCEHVIEEAARLTHLLLVACGRLRVLATSREPLGITGEALWPLGPLALPPVGADPVEILGYPAIRLFGDRAAAVNPAFTLSPANADVVSRICTALDGLPLAIELAAARLRSLPVADVAARLDDRLDDRFRLLSRGSRTAAPRHQTLWAVVEWSWELLSPPERLLARRLTVFAGGATVEAAEVVCGGPGLDVADLLVELTDKSLVEASGGRYRMLDTIRVFCAQQLSDAGEVEAVSRAHAVHFLSLAEAGDVHLRGGDQLGWLARFNAEQSNLQAALRWAARHDPALGLRLTSALSFSWLLRGLRGEAAPLVAELLATIDHEPPAGLEQEFAAAVLNVAAGGGQGSRLAADVERAGDIILRLTESPRQPFIMVLMAQVLGFRGIEMEPGPPFDPTSAWLVALGHLGQGFYGFYTGQTEVAEREFGQALADFRRLQDGWGMATAMDTLAALASWRGDHTRAVRLIDEALALLHGLGVLEDMSGLLANRAGIRVRGGDLAGAEVDYHRAVELGQRSGVAEALAGAYVGLGELARLRGDLVTAQDRYEAAASRLGSLWASGEPRWRLLIASGWLAEARGDATAARTRYQEAHRYALATRNNLVAAYAAEGLAGIAALDGDGEGAALLLGLGVTLRGCAIVGDPDVARVTDHARDLTDTATFDRAYARGTSTDREAALAHLAAATVPTSPTGPTPGPTLG